ncbi:MAG: hypothetical protein J0I77_17605 [Rudaea sp.]|uniref:hypothetical protein n=1 Tax=unclassified Rudaea TaxID=2627037 RepID=UPI0010FA432D|nr:MULTISPECIES: hypothetical protein [unclassified Rudaea]MBN8887544.1 hypothetical protein [Rudaea sp.]MBQ3301392.1 hypothetical protein [Eggerthellaceae bacterium]
MSAVLDFCAFRNERYGAPTATVRERVAQALRNTGMSAAVYSQAIDRAKRHDSESKGDRELQARGVIAWAKEQPKGAA